MADGTTTATYGYEYGIDPLVEIGAIRAFGTRLLVRAIMRTDSYDLQNGGTLHTVETNSSDADAFRVVSVGAGVARWCADNGEQAPEAGYEIECSSVAADRVGKDPTGRYWLIDIRDVTAIIVPIPIDDADLLAAVKRAKDRAQNRVVAPPPNLGEALIDPSYVATR